MHSNIPRLKIVLCAALAAATGISTSAAGAEQMEEITIEAERPSSRSAIGAPIQTVSTKRTVSYADISLTTASGAKVLETRIRDAATSACTELAQKYPVPAEGDTTRKCIDDAIAGAMVDARKAIDSAKFASDSD